jgi:hypothetical protein
MDHIPEITTAPTSDTSRSPSINSEPPNDQLRTSNFTLRVARTEDDIADHFVVTFAKSGTLTIQDLLKEPSISQLLQSAENFGVNISEPALLAVADDVSQARTIYLTPTPNNSFRDFAVWVGHVSHTIEQLKTKKVGLYLCKDSLPSEQLKELINQTIRVFVENKIANDICLIVGQHAYTDILSTALQLKQELDGPYAALHILH